MSRIDATDRPELLNEVSHSQFYNLVDSDVRNKLDPAVARKLRDEIVIPRWLSTLRLMKSTLENSIAAKKAEAKAKRLALVIELEAAEQQVRLLRQARGTDTDDYAARLGVASQLRVQIATAAAGYEEWRLRVLRMKSAVEDRLSEARWLDRLNRGEDDLQVRLTSSDARVHQLIEAIDRHRAGIEPVDALSADEDLWSVL